MNGTLTTKQKYRKEYYQRNKEVIRSRSRNNHLLNRDNRLKNAKQRYLDYYPQVILTRVKQRAKMKNIPFDLNLEDIIFPEFCPVLGMKLERSFEGKPLSNSPSIDRIDPQKGYVKDNIMMMSYKANMMKNDATREELIKFAKWILNA